MVFIWGINLYLYSQVWKSTVYIDTPLETTTTTTTIPQNVTIIISKKCNLDSDCSWQNTNCCPGTDWKCINANESEIKCIGTILCPQHYLPEPTSECKCDRGECVG